MPSSRELLDSYLCERSLCVTPKVLKSEERYLLLFLGFLRSLGIEEVGQISLWHLRAFRMELESTKEMALSYLLHHLRPARSFLVWCYETGHTLVDVSFYELPRWRYPSIQVPSVAQVQKLLNAPDPRTLIGRRDRLILESFYTLGLRKAESHRLNVTDLSLSRLTVRVIGKGDVERRIPLSSRLAGLFGAYIQDIRPKFRPQPDEQALWVSLQTRGRLHPCGLGRRVCKAAQKVGLSGVYPHLLRHACATHMLQRGALLEHVQLLLGHKDPGSTQRYLHLSEQDIRDEVYRFHPRYQNGAATRA